MTILVDAIAATVEFLVTNTSLSPFMMIGFFVGVIVVAACRASFGGPGVVRTYR